MKSRNLLFASVAALFVMALPATTAHALLVKVSVNFGPTITGPDNGTLVVVANPGDMLRITWALGTDTDIDRYRGLISGVDTSEITRDVGSALELTGQGFDPGGNPNAPSIGEFAYDAWSDGAPIGFAGNGGELWRIEYVVTNPVTDAVSGHHVHDSSAGFSASPSRPALVRERRTEAVSASLRIDAIPEPSTLLLLGLGLASLATVHRGLRRCG